MIVVDASVVVTALADDGHDGDRVRDRMRDERLTAELGGDLLAAIYGELNRLEAGAFRLCSRPRRVA